MEGHAFSLAAVAMIAVSVVLAAAVVVVAGGILHYPKTYYIYTH